MSHVRRTQYSIYMAGLRVNRNNAKLFNNVGHVQELSKNFTEALRYFKQATMYVYMCHCSSCVTVSHSAKYKMK